MLCKSFSPLGFFQVQIYFSATQRHTTVANSFGKATLGDRACGVFSTSLLCKLGLLHTYDIEVLQHIVRCLDVLAAFGRVF